MSTVLNDAVAYAKQFLDNEKLLFDYVITEGENCVAGMGLELKRAAQNPDTNDYDVLILIASDLLREGKPLPIWLGKFIADVVEGKRKRPTKRGIDKYKNWERDYKLFRAVVGVAKKFDLPLFNNNELSKKAAAADIVSMASNLKVGIIINAYKKVQQLGVNF